MMKGWRRYTEHKMFSQMQFHAASFFPQHLFCCWKNTFLLKGSRKKYFHYAG